MPEKFKCLYKIGFVFFALFILIELMTLLTALAQRYSIAEPLINLIIIIVLFMLFLWYMNQGQKKGWFRCFKCGEERPLARIPKNFKQMITGGWTCSKCRTEVIPQNKMQNIIWIGICLALILIGLAIILMT